MKLYLSLTRRKLLLMLCALLVTLLFITEWQSVTAKPKTGENASARMRFAKNMGYEVGAPLSVTRCRVADTIPAGKPLYALGGCLVTVYRYAVTNRAYTDLDLIVYRNRVIATRLIDYSKEDVYGKNQIGSFSFQPASNEP
ncbi:MAG: hypothetical protein MJ132_08255 [Clostridia bacterium]|nr:hypothetical protein [Clostridia bacterium]